MTRFAHLISSGVGPKHSFTIGAWLGWMQSLPPKPRRRARCVSARTGSGELKAVVIPSTGGWQSGDSGYQHQLRSEVKQFLAFALNAEIELEIDVAEHQTFDMRRVREVRDVPETAGRFDDREQARVRDCSEVFDAFRFGEYDAGNAWPFA